MTDLEAFAREIIQASWDGCDGGDIIQEMALRHRLIRRVKFNPKIHKDYGYCEPGDPWFEFNGPLARTPA